MQQVDRQSSDRVDQHFRIYYTDHTPQREEPELEDPTRVVSYQGTLQQVLRDLSDWVEQGIVPPPSTVYRIADGPVVVSPNPTERKGLQPVVTLTVNGGPLIRPGWTPSGRPPVATRYACFGAGSVVPP
jgi:hypothetical protein